MSSEIVEALVAQRQGLDDELVAIRKELAASRQKRKDATRRQWHLTEWLQHVLLILYYLAGYKVAAAVPFLRTSARKRKWPARGDAELGVIVDDLFLDTDADVFAALVDTTEPRDLSAMREAMRFYTEWSLISWTEA